MPTTAETLATALEHHRAGRLAEAEPLYRRILAHDPAAADAWHFLGALYLQSARFGEAVEHLQRAVALRPAASDFYSHLGTAYSGLAQSRRGNRRLAHARSSWRRARPRPITTSARPCATPAASTRPWPASSMPSPPTRGGPRPSTTWPTRWSSSSGSTRPRSPTARALAARSGYLKAMTNLGNLLCRRERIDEALAMFEAAVAADASYAPAQLNLGTILRDVGRYDEAIASLRRAWRSTRPRPKPTTCWARPCNPRPVGPRPKRATSKPCGSTPSWATPTFRRPRFASARATSKAGWPNTNGGCSARVFASAGSTRRAGTARRWPAAPSCCTPNRAWATRCSSFATPPTSRRGRPPSSSSAQKPLAPLLATVAGIDALVAAGEALPAYDLECSLMSLPHKLGLSETQLAPIPTLSPRASGSSAGAAS